MIVTLINQFNVTGTVTGAFNGEKSATGARDIYATIWVSGALCGDFVFKAVPADVPDLQTGDKVSFERHGSVSQSGLGDHEIATLKRLVDIHGTAEIIPFKPR